MANDEDKSELFNPVPFKLLRSTKANIAGIIMAGAEIDDLLSMALCRLAKVDPISGAILMGELAISAKLKRLEFFLKTADSHTKRNFDLHIRAELSEFIAYRNTIAHGIYVGVMGGMACFFTMKFQEVGTETATTLLRRIELCHFPRIEQKGRQLINYLQTVFELSPMHEIYHYKLGQERNRSQSSQPKNSHSKPKSQP